MLFFDLPDDITITILQRLMPTCDEESGMGLVKDINAARATSTKMRVLIDEGMAPFWEALCKRAWGFQRRPWWGMNAMHLPTNRLPPPWSDVFRFSLQVLERSPLRFVKNKSEEVQSYVLPAHMLLQRTVRLIKTLGWTDARELILSVLGLCMVRVEEAHRAGYADAVRGVLEVLSGFVDGVGVAWQEVCVDARARYMPGTTRWRDYRKTEDHKRLLSTLKKKWGNHGDADIFEAVDELPELLRKGYDVTLDDEIIQLVSNCTHPYVNRDLPADMQWSSAFVRVDELMTPNYGIHLTPLQRGTRQFLAQNAENDFEVNCYLSSAIAQEDQERLERYLCHIPHPDDFAAALVNLVEGPHDDDDECKDYVKLMFESWHYDAADVERWMKENRPGSEPLFFLTTEHECDDELVHIVAQHARVAPSLDITSEQRLETCLSTIARECSASTVRYVLEKAVEEEGPLVLHGHGYLYDFAATKARRDLFDVLIDLEVPPPPADNPSVGHLVRSQLGMEAYLSYSALESVWMDSVWREDAFP